MADPHTIIHLSTVQRKDVSPIDRDILTVLSILQHRTNFFATTQKEIAQVACSSIKQVRKSLRALGLADLIKIRRHRNGKIKSISVHAITARNNRLYWMEKTREDERARRAKLTLVQLPKTAEN